MVAQQLRSTGSNLGLNRLEELRKTAGVIPGIVEDVDAKQVSLLFVVAGHVEKVEALTDPDTSLCKLSGSAIP
jgi:hypothetical protein